MNKFINKILNIKPITLIIKTLIISFFDLYWKPFSQNYHKVHIIFNFYSIIMISCRFAKGGIDMERNWLDITALILIIIGAINWGLIGFFEFDLISYFFGTLTAVTRIIFAVVGIVTALTAYASAATPAGRIEWRFYN